MFFRSTILARICFICMGLMFSCSVSRGQAAKNLITNGGFEADANGWLWNATPAAKAAGSVDRTQSHSGKASYRITRAGAYEPHVASFILQAVPGLEVNTTYRLTAWVKGNSVNNCWMGGGPGWAQRHMFPNDTYGWTQVSADITSGPDRTPMDIMFSCESPTGSLWIDDIELVKVADYQGARVFPAMPRPGLFPTMRFYPAIADSAATRAPILSFRHEKDSRFGADVQLRWSQEALRVRLNVLDPSKGRIYLGNAIWRGDSVQLAFDTDPLTPKSGYTASCVDFAIAPEEGDTVEIVQFSGDQAHLTTGNCRRSSTGYEMNLVIPWKALGLAGPPTNLGMNILVNDSQLNDDRRYVEWTPGIGQSKQPDQFARICMVPADATLAAGVLIVPQEYDGQSTIRGRYVDYSIAPHAEENFTLQTTSSGKNKVLLDKLALPATTAGMVRELSFEIPAAWFAAEGLHRIESLVNGAVTGTGAVNRVDAATFVKSELPQLKNRYNTLKARWDAQSAWRDDGYLIMGFSLVGRFIDRVERNGPRGDQTLAWSKLQISESNVVLNQVEARLNRLAAKTAQVYVRPGVPEAYRVDNGVLQGRYGDQWRPVVMYGYNSWHEAVERMSVVSAEGANMLEQEIGPIHMIHNKTEPGQSLYSVNTEGVNEWSKIFPKAQKNNLAIELLLALHYLPDWAAKMDSIYSPDKASWDTDSPSLRKVQESYIRAIVSKVKDYPSLFAVNLSNEPAYRYSGRTPNSAAAWPEFLKKKHGSIGDLNKIYGTSYQKFEDVPVPPLGTPRRDQVAARRAHYDWVIFNQEHYAKFFEWINGIVKSIAPQAPTHVKIINRIFDPATIEVGIDPELFSDITDFAGNDSFTLPHGGGPYYYDWQMGTMFFDLQHSFRGQIVLNSENHVIPDRLPATSIDPNLNRAAYWQQALHHSPASSAWVWADPPPGDSDLLGCVYLRPANLFATGHTMVDMNRWAKELAILSQQKAQVAMIYSMPSLYWNRSYSATARHIYTDLAFTGQPIIFISEKQLASGQRSPANKDVTCLILPQATHLSESAWAGLEKFIAAGGKVIAIGEDCLRYDEYQQERTRRLTGVINLPLPLAREFAPHVPLRECLKRLGIPAPMLKNAATQTDLWGVEYRAAVLPDRTLITMTNMTRTTLRAAWPADGNAVDLLDDQSPIDLKNIELPCMQPRLIEIRK